MSRSICETHGCTRPVAGALFGPIRLWLCARCLMVNVELNWRRRCLHTAEPVTVEGVK